MSVAAATPGPATTPATPAPSPGPSPAPSPDAPGRGAPPLALVGVTAASAAVGALVVVRHLGTKPLWRDEAITVSVASRPVLRILTVLPHHDANAGLYYLLLHGWLRLGGGPAWARGFSATCLVATAAVAAWAGARWRGWETGLAVGLLVALNPFLVYYGQDARPYALAVLLAALSTVALFARPEGPAPRAYIAATIVLVYTDLFALLYVAALAAAGVAVHRFRHQLLPPALKRCWWVIAAAVVPLAFVMVVFERGQISWLPRPSARVLSDTVTAMSSGWLGLEVVVVLAVVALIAARGRQRLVLAALATAFALPPLLLWCVGQVTAVYIDRYVICSALALIAVAGAGLATLRERLGRAGGLAALVVLAGLLVLGGQRVARVEASRYKVDNAPAVVTFIQSRARAGDAVAYAGGGLRTVVEAARPTAAFPVDVALAPGGQAFRQHDLYAREVSAPELLTRLALVDRLWLVTDPSDQAYPQGGPFLQLKSLVRATYQPATTTSFGTIDVTLLVRRP